MKIGRGCRDEEREEGKRNPFPPLFSPTPQFGSNLLFLAVSLTKGGRGEEESKKNLHLRIICRICPGKEDLKPSDNRRFSQINYFYKTVAVAKNGLGSEGTSFFSPPPQF